MDNQPDHLPGMVDPLIVDDTQGDFGGNPIIRPERKIPQSIYKVEKFYYLNWLRADCGVSGSVLTVV